MFRMWSNAWFDACTPVAVGKALRSKKNEDILKLTKNPKGNNGLVCIWFGLFYPAEGLRTAFKASVCMSVF